jgi:hypothetical protein
MPGFSQSLVDITLQSLSLSGKRDSSTAAGHAPGQEVFSSVEAWITLKVDFREKNLYSVYVSVSSAKGGVLLRNSNRLSPSHPFP